MYMKNRVLTIQYGSRWNYYYLNMVTIGAARDNFLGLIENREQFIRYMVDFYPNLLDNWEKEELNKIAKISQDVGGGDKEIESSVFRSESAKLDFKADMENLFYQACFIIAYAHFESTVNSLYKKATVKEKIDLICKRNNKNLSSKAEKAKEWLTKEGSLVRNNLIHNNTGTIRNKEKIKDIVNSRNGEETGMYFDGESIAFQSPEYINKLLKNSHIILEELCNMEGHTKKHLNKH